ncbi:MAG: hypothetical protein WCR06_07680 [bacterium]
MIKDLPGQTYMPFAAPAARTDCADAQSAEESAARALCKALPEKHTCNLREAAILLGCCVRTVMRMIEEGTLLCQYANAQFEAECKHARPVMRLPRPFDAAREKFLSVEEMRLRKSNLQG